MDDRKLIAMSRSKSRRSVGAPQLRRNVADLRALAHPLRLRMMELFAESPKTTKQVAELLGEPPTRLYHHVAALERAGLLQLQGTRPNRGAIEKWYRSTAQQLQDSPRRRGSDTARSRGRRAVAVTALEQAKQEIMAIPVGVKEPAFLTRLIVVVAPSEISAVRQRLMGAVQELGRELQADDGRAETDTEKCERWALTVAFAPTMAPRRRTAER